MKIAVFGDSFAAGEGSTSWVSILESRFDNVTRLGRTGASLFYCYKKFIENNHDLDACVFVVTNPGRLYHDIEEVNGPIGTFTSLNWIKQAKNSPIYQSFPDIVDAAEKYYVHLQSSYYDNTVHKLLIKEIISLSCELNIKNIILPVSIYSDFDNYPKYYDAGFMLSKINLNEKIYYDIPEKAMEKHKRMQNHMTDENNQILADLLTRILQGEELKITMEHFNFNSLSPVEIYYEL